MELTITTQDIKKYGSNTAIILSYLKEIGATEWTSLSPTKLEFFMSYAMQHRVFKKLVKLGIVEVTHAGWPAQRSVRLK